MSVLTWRPATVYPKGSIARPTASAPAAPPSFTNFSFEDDLTGWTTTGALTLQNDAPNSFSGTKHLRAVGPTSNVSVSTTDIFPVVPGQAISAKCMIRVQNAADQVGGAVVLSWFDGTNTFISNSEGTQVNVLSSGYRESRVNATAPANAAGVRLAFFGFLLQSGTLRVDQFSWDYQPQPTTSNLAYRAVQPEIGTSAATEPVWPVTAGLQVVDGTVTWEAFVANVVVWEAEPILISGANEPAWPIDPGEVVNDNGIAWKCVAKNVKDTNCPNTKVVAIAASKVFAGDGDIVRYSATGNPTDWSSRDDAGFLPSGLQQNGANEVSVLNLYRSNLSVFNASTFQMWQVDPDPEQMAVLDAMEGIGSVWQRASQPVANELFFLTPLGIRTVGIAGGSTNLAAGDVGMPIDTIVRQRVEAAIADGIEPIAAYYPAAGQYWLIFSGLPLTISNPLPDPTIGISVNHAFVAAGGTPPYTFYVTNPSLPAGLTLSTAGVVTGEPTTATGYTFTVTVFDAEGQSASLPQTVTVYPLWGIAHTSAEDVLSENAIAPRYGEYTSCVPGRIYLSGPSNTTKSQVFTSDINNFEGWSTEGTVVSNARYVATNGSVYIATTNNFTGGAYTYYRSTDGGSTWTAINTLQYTPSTGARQDVIYTGSVFLLLDRYAGPLEAVWRSATGADGSWTRTLLPSQMQSWGQCVMASDGNGVIVLANKLGNMARSADHGASWTVLSSNGSGSTLDSAAYMNGTFVLTDGFDAITSINGGLTFNSFTVPVSSYLTGLTAGDGKFWGADFQTNNVLWSTDGQSWTSEELEFDTTFQCYTVGFIDIGSKKAVLAFGRSLINYTNGLGFGGRIMARPIAGNIIATMEYPDP